MALSEKTVTDQITADEYGRVFIRERTDIIRDGEVIASSYHRRHIEPDASLTGEDVRTTTIAKAARKDALPVPTE